jgi:hypothetical protein
LLLVPALREVTLDPAVDTLMAGVDYSIELAKL